VHLPWHVAGQRQYWRVVAARFVKPGDQMRTARTGGAGAYRERAGEVGLAGGGQCRAFFMPDANPFHLAFSNRIRQRIKGIADQSKNMFDADLIEHADQELRNRLCPFVAPDPNLSPSQNRPARIGLRLSDHLLPM
jgi:hypothetical protein